MGARGFRRSSRVACCFVFVAGLTAACGRRPPVVADPSPLDLVIRGGDLIDGTGTPARRVDVGVKGDRIVALGDLSGRRAARTLDATGRIVAPGFIDVLSQSSLSLLVDGRGLSHLHQGITTEVIGEGGSPAQWTRADWPTIAAAYGTKRELEELGLTYDWDGHDGYFERLARQGISVNLGTYASHDLLRMGVVGLAARPPTADEQARMEARLDEAMRAGAFGLSTALIYPPSSYSTTGELVGLARVAARHGGVYVSHVRGEGERGLEAIDEAIEIGERSGAPVLVFHLKRAGRAAWGTMGEAGARIERARARGVDVSACVYPYTGAGTGLRAPLPEWAQEGGVDALVRRLRDPAQRARLRRELETLDKGLGRVDFDTIQIAWVPSDGTPGVMGKRVSEIARERGRPAVETYFDLLVENRANVFAFYHAMSEDDLVTALRWPWVSIATDAEATSPAGVLGRGLVHPRAYGTYPRVLARYVRERKVLSLPEAIRRMTSLPAAQIRLSGRGVVREGNYADLVVFDPATIADRATFERPHQLAVGVEHVVVNGVVTLERGAHTGARAGRALVGPGRRSRGEADASGGGPGLEAGPPRSEH